MKILTLKEREIMKIFWKMERAFVHDIIVQLENPQVPYNTISSIVRILEKKGFLEHKAYGHTHEYFIKIQREEYLKYFIDSILERQFDGSFSKMVTFYAEESNIDITNTENMTILRW